MNHGTVLLVEDNPDDEALAMRALRKNNLANDVTIARNGAQALEYLMLTDETRESTEGPLPTVVLLDLKLPKVDGLEVLRRIRADKRTKYLPVVVLTSSSEERDIVESYRLGANSYVRKPVQFEEFVNAVSSLGLYWLVINEKPPQKAGE